MKLLKNKFNLKTQFKRYGENLFRLLYFSLILKLPSPIFNCAFETIKYEFENFSLQLVFIIQFTFCFISVIFRWVVFIYSRTSFPLFAFLYLPDFISCSELSARLFSLLLFFLCWYSGALTLLPEWNSYLMWIYSGLHNIFLLCFCLLQIIMVYKPFQAFQRVLYY